MPRKPKPRLLLRSAQPVIADNVIAVKDITSHLPRLSVDWRLYRVQMSNGYGPFHNSVRWMVEGYSENNTSVLRRAA